MSGLPSGGGDLNIKKEEEEEDERRYENVRSNPGNLHQNMQQHIAGNSRLQYQHNRGAFRSNPSRQFPTQERMNRLAERAKSKRIDNALRRVQSLAPSVHFSCAQCGSPDHVFKNCPDCDEDGWLRGCPKCNSKAHSLADCPLGNLTESQEWHFVRQCRENRPPLEHFQDWRMIPRPASAKTPCYPWTPQYAISSRLESMGRIIQDDRVADPYWTDQTIIENTPQQICPDARCSPENRELWRVTVASRSLNLEPTQTTRAPPLAPRSTRSSQKHVYQTTQSSRIPHSMRPVAQASRLPLQVNIPADTFTLLLATLASTNVVQAASRNVDFSIEPRGRSLSRREVIDYSAGSERGSTPRRITQYTAESMKGPPSPRRGRVLEYQAESMRGSPPPKKRRALEYPAESVRGSPSPRGGRTLEYQAESMRGSPPPRRRRELDYPSESMRGSPPPRRRNQDYPTESMRRSPSSRNRYSDYSFESTRGSPPPRSRNSDYSFESKRESPPFRRRYSDYLAESERGSLPGRGRDLFPTDETEKRKRQQSPSGSTNDREYQKKPKIDRAICFNCGSTHHSASRCPDHENTTCYTCGGKGHLQRYCPTTRRSNRPPRRG